MTTRDKTTDDDMRSEYDFSGQKGVRGKYHLRYRQGHTVRVHREDGSTNVRHFKLEEGAVLLDPDVRAYFPDSETVNTALRVLIQAVPKKGPVTAPSKA
jgi:hypothetical protein